MNRPSIRTTLSALALVALFLLSSTPAYAQGVRYTPVSESLADTFALALDTEATLPINYGIPELRRRMPTISYPVLAEQFQVEGQVLVEFIVNEKGRVIRSTIRKKLGYGCEQEVLRVLRHTRFVPSLDASGQPQQVRYLAAFDFKLDS